MTSGRYVVIFFFFKQKTAYEMRISDWSSDVCSSDLQLRAFFANEYRGGVGVGRHHRGHDRRVDDAQAVYALHAQRGVDHRSGLAAHAAGARYMEYGTAPLAFEIGPVPAPLQGLARPVSRAGADPPPNTEESHE